VSPPATHARPALLASMHAPGERPAVVVTSGRGMELTLSDGRTVLDAGSLSSCILGHCPPELVAAVQAAAGQGYVGDTVGYAAREQAAEDLLRIGFAGEPWADTVAWFVSSSEAADLGLLLAQELTGCQPLVCRSNGYHGGVGLSREASTQPMWSAELCSRSGGVTPRPFALNPIRRLPVPGCWAGDPGDGHVCAEDCLRDAPAALDGAAAVIMDYSQGGACPSPQYQDTLAAMAREAGTLWIADETVTALGRLGRGFAFQRGVSRPDIVQLGKVLTAGAAPGGALVLSRDVVAALGDRRWTTASTFRGHPLTMAAVSTVLRIVERDGLVQHAADVGEALGRDLHEIVARHPSAERVFGEGMMWVVKLAAPSEFAEGTWHGDGPGTPLTDVVQRAALDAGVFVGVYSGESVWLVPPLIATAEQLARAAAALDEALTVADRQLETGASR
jgi:4-aminobutyrate aminotransferase-like enzyme